MSSRDCRVVIHMLRPPTVTIAATCRASELLVCISMSIARVRAADEFELELHTGRVNDGWKSAGPENFGRPETGLGSCQPAGSQPDPVSAGWKPASLYNSICTQFAVLSCFDVMILKCCFKTTSHDV